jgi:hypothetical protein
VATPWIWDKGGGLSEGDSDDDGEHPIYTVKPWKPVKATEAVALSLCDGTGCDALSLEKVGWEEIEIERIIAVEKSKTQRKICDAANPATDTFPVVGHGLNGSHDITLITDKDIRTMRHAQAAASWARVCGFLQASPAP